MSKFWTESGGVPDEKLIRPTVVLVSEVDEKEGNKIVAKVLESIDNPLDLMSFDDFSLANCLKNGVSYKALMIPQDLRFGHESEIDAYHERLELINDKLFVQPKTEIL